jgi:hypothetical protein
MGQTPMDAIDANTGEITQPEVANVPTTDA